MEGGDGREGTGGTGGRGGRGGAEDGTAQLRSWGTEASPWLFTLQLMQLRYVKATPPSTGGRVQFTQHQNLTPVHQCTSTPVHQYTSTEEKHTDAPYWSGYVVQSTAQMGNN